VFLGDRKLFPFNAVLCYEY